jgi:murein DD-endopeptidase MepM/ murein hydrolase activator NlpD
VNAPARQPGRRLISSTRQADGTIIERYADGTVEHINRNGGTKSISAPIKNPFTPYQEAIFAAVKRGAKRMGPIPGWRVPAKKKQIGPNNKEYSDGRYSATGKERWRKYGNGKGKPHRGIDIPATIGDPVYAAASGIVELRAQGGDFGLRIKLRHPDGTRTLYAHLSVQSVTVGQNVRIGDIIGNVGISGNAYNSGSHLHFEAYGVNGDRTDPTIWINTGGFNP